MSQDKQSLIASKDLIGVYSNKSFAPIIRKTINDVIKSYPKEVKKLINHIGLSTDNTYDSDLTPLEKTIHFKLNVNYSINGSEQGISYYTKWEFTDKSGLSSTFKGTIDDWCLAINQVNKAVNRACFKIANSDGFRVKQACNMMLQGLKKNKKGT